MRGGAGIIEAMADDEKTPEDGETDSVQENRIAIGIALGLPFGVALSLLLDNWGLVGVGLMLGLVFGAIPVKGDSDDAPDSAASGDDEGPSPK